MVYDVILVGGGIASNSAAIYTSRASLKTLVISGPELDQLSTTTLVENYPGFPEGVMGPELTVNSRKQAQKFGAEYIEGKVDKIEKKGEGNFVVNAGDKSYSGKTVIIATGAFARRLGIPGEDEYFGKGVSVCAVCDAALYKDKDVIVVGGGDVAMEETLALARFAKKVFIIHRKDKFGASKAMQDKIFALKDKVEIKWNTVVTGVLGDGKFVTGAKLKSGDKEEEFNCEGIFLAIGHIPNTGFLKGVIDLDDHGYIITDKLSQTNVDGIYAAGDCQDSVFRQAITSAGTGCESALRAESYIENLK